MVLVATCPITTPSMDGRSAFGLVWWDVSVTIMTVGTT